MLIVGICLCSYIVISWIQVVCNAHKSDKVYQYKTRPVKKTPALIDPWKDSKYVGSAWNLLDIKICNECDEEFFGQKGISFKLLSESSTPDKLPKDKTREAVIRNIILKAASSSRNTNNHYLES